jgi:pyruvate kinase
MTAPLDGLLAAVEELLAQLDSSARSHRDQIAVVFEDNRAGAVNLVHYTTLRQQDLRELQSDLTDLGVTSLTTAEPNVRAKVRAADNVLAALHGDPLRWDVDVLGKELDTGDEILRAHSDALFGVQRPGRPTRIMVTMPSEAAVDPGLAVAYVKAGMDVARINCAHDGPNAWLKMVGHIRAAAAGVGRQVLVSMDVAGPKLRTGAIAPGPAVGRARVVRDDTGRLLAPAAIWLVPVSNAGDPPVPANRAGRPPLTIRVDRGWLSARRRGDSITLRDARGRHREFLVSDASEAGVLAISEYSAYVADGARLSCDGSTTTAIGIPPLVRKLFLRPGDELVLTDDPAAVDVPLPGQVARIGCTLPEAVAALRPGQPVLLDDGAVAAVVESVSAGQATLRIVRTKPGGQHLAAEKGINMPDTDLPLAALTAEDRSHLSFIATHADMVAVSFVRSVADIDQVLQALDDAGADTLGLLLKIETAQGFRELPSMLLAAMRRPRIGVMIARGDLAVEVGFERLAELPRQILALCETAHVPVIWATQVLETLALTGLPSRAEITDAATAQRSECVMLNKGPHMPEAIKTLDDILARMGQAQHKSRTLLRHVHSWDDQ